MEIKNIVILTGAGISAESGLETFRASDGLWCNHRVEDVATPEAFERDPKLVQDFYNMRRAQLKQVEPNAAHHALAELCRDWGHGDVLIVTQNVDDLHDRALQAAQVSSGQHLIHMHGELLKARHCITNDISHCHDDLQPGLLRPHIVWFGEMPLDMDRIHDALEDCDLFISIGTSGNVYPAAGFVAQANAAGALSIELNLEASHTASQFSQQHYGKATQLVPEFVTQLLKR